ncbi:hypothetical protein VTO42DRAFT_2402 [Malbranchea cinnamomea]
MSLTSAPIMAPASPWVVEVPVFLVSRGDPASMEQGETRAPGMIRASGRGGGGGQMELLEGGTPLHSPRPGRLFSAGVGLPSIRIKVCAASRSHLVSPLSASAYQGHRTTVTTATTTSTPSPKCVSSRPESRTEKGKEETNAEKK